MIRYILTDISFSFGPPSFFSEHMLLNSLHDKIKSSLLHDMGRICFEKMCFLVQGINRLLYIKQLKIHQGRNSHQRQCDAMSSSFVSDRLRLKPVLCTIWSQVMGLFKSVQQQQYMAFTEYLLCASLCNCNISPNTFCY